MSPLKTSRFKKTLSEKEIAWAVSMIAQGFSEKECANTLQCSRPTVVKALEAFKKKDAEAE